MLAELKLLGDHDLRVVIEISKDLISIKKKEEKKKEVLQKKKEVLEKKKEVLETKRKGRVDKIALSKPVLADYADNKNAYHKARYWWDKFHNPKCRHYVGFKEEAGAKE